MQWLGELARTAGLSQRCLKASSDLSDGAGWVGAHLETEMRVTHETLLLQTQDHGNTGEAEARSLSRKNISTDKMPAKHTLQKCILFS